MLWRFGLQGGRTPDELKEVLTESAFWELVAVTELWPWGEDAKDIRTATAVRVAAEIGSGKRQKIRKFLPFKRWDPSKRLTRKRVMEMLHGFFGTRPDGS